MIDNGKEEPLDMGKSKLTEQFIKKAIEYIRDGNYVSVACKALGVSEVTWYEYIKQAKEEISIGLTEEDSLAIKFLNQLDKAAADAEAEAVKVLRTQGRKNWLANAWYLERRFPKRWGAAEVLARDEEVAEGRTEQTQLERAMMSKSAEGVWDEEEEQEDINTDRNS